MFKLSLVVIVACVLGGYHLASGQTEGYSKLDSNCYRWLCTSSVETKKPVAIMLKSDIGPATVSPCLVKYGKGMLKLDAETMKGIDPSWIKLVRVSNDKKLSSKYGTSGSKGIVLIELYEEKLTYVLNAVNRY